MYADFDLLVPEKLDEALTMIGDTGSGRKPLGGGTNLVVEMRATGEGPDALISVGRLPCLHGIQIDANKVTLGAATTVSELLRHPGMEQVGAALVGAARVFAGQMVRNTATIAGNICCGSPAADLVPPLLALGASVTLQSSRSNREVPLVEYFTGYKESVCKPNELLTQICWPRPTAASASRFYKLGRRKGDAITVVGVAVSLTVEAGTCTEVRIALGAVGPYVLRTVKAEAILRGQILTPELIDAAARQAAEDVTPIDDVRASGAYRKQQVLVLVRRLLAQTLESLA
jgi:carbon-monoxide dehydrogenase medium subunit